MFLNSIQMLDKSRLVFISEQKRRTPFEHLSYYQSINHL